MTKLSSYIAGCKIASLTAMKNYRQIDFREDLKSAMKPAGISDELITLSINDNQITNEIFLEDVSNILNSGEVPNLWVSEE